MRNLSEAKNKNPNQISPEGSSQNELTYHPQNSQTVTVYDAEIATLEERRPELEAERQRLAAGLVAIEGFDGQTVQVDLSQFLAHSGGDADGLVSNNPVLNERLQELLKGSPVFGELTKVYHTK